EEHNRPRILESVLGIADEIIIVDSGSTDGTEAVAREHGAAFHFRKWTNYSDQKNYAASLTRTDWILSLDADEELSSALQTSIVDWKKRTVQDRKSTRLNSSHGSISYAVFCLKKKNKRNKT